FNAQTTIGNTDANRLLSANRGQLNLQKYSGQLPGTKKTYSEMLEYAPGVTLIKEVGGFDSLVGKTMQGYIAQEQYKGLPQKVKGLFADSDYRDSVFGWIPGKLDQMTWLSIWKATRKQVKKETRLAGADLLQETGKRFTKIINDTQVYGSVLSQSHAMRSKSPIMKMTTAFMAEPTVNYNMLLRFGRELQNKNIKKAFAIGVSLVVSSVAQGVLKSLVTAGRDDDKEKTYAEKYLRDVVNELLGNLPFNWIIGLRDIISWLQGYSNERDDLSVITDLLESVAEVFDSEETVENRMQALVTALSTVIGWPLGNFWRDTEMIVRAILSIGEERDLTATATSIGYSIAENFSFWSNALLRDTPLYWDNSREKYFERAYLALQEGDGQKYRDTLDYIRRNEKVTEKDIRNGIAKQIAVHSETAQTAAAAYMVGDTYGYEQGLFALVDLGFDEETAAKGIEKAQAEIEKLLDGAAAQELQKNTQERDNVIADLADLFGDADSLADLYADVLQDAQEDDEEEEPVLRYIVSDVARTLQYGDLNQAIEIRDYLLENGKTSESIRTAVTTAIKPLYLQAYKDGDMNAVSDY
ncbi:MAG: hypothetical protein IKM24_08540, partial [Clostridia bacterium]|nr:hypothetical protein [Clostridia bacterium]